MRQIRLPAAWRQVKVAYVPKAGKSSHINAKNFGSISLSLFLLKTLKRLMELFFKSRVPKIRLLIA